MGTIGSRHASMIIQNTRNVLAIECICSLQAAEYRGVDKMSSYTREKLQALREVVPSITQDRIFSTDIKQVAEWLKTND